MSADGWPVDRRFAGQTVFCCASGPSFTCDVARRLAGQRCIVVNGSLHNAAAAGLDGEMLLIGDSGAFKKNRRAVERWRGTVVTQSRYAQEQMPERLRRIEPVEAEGFDLPAGVVRKGRSSGHVAVSLAVAMGAQRIVLVGYDMRLVEGREHCHGDYAGKPRDLGVYEREFIPGFNGWRSAALASGVEIVNATPGSALREFPTAELDDELARSRPRDEAA